MIKIFKSNKLTSLFLVIMCMIIIFNPYYYAKSCLNGVSVWAFKVMPTMFPFFVLTKLIANLNQPKENFLDKFFYKAYRTPNGSFLTFFLSSLSGYPMGAKLICSMHENKYITRNDAKKMLSFCSISGPMFMIGTVGVSMLYNYKAGIIILVSNILACLMNGLLYRGKIKSESQQQHILSKENNFTLSDCVYDSLISILLIGAYIVLSFIFIDMLEYFNILHKISNAICCVINKQQYLDVVNSCLKGIIEITRGIYDLSLTNISITVKTVIASTLVGFGGISVLLQSFAFLNKLNISPKNMIQQKLSQGVLCFVISLVLSFIAF